VARRAALAFAERALRAGLPAGRDGYQALLGCLQQGRVVDDATSVLVDQTVGVWARPGFETLVSLPRLRFEPFGYHCLGRSEAISVRTLRPLLPPCYPTLADCFEFGLDLILEGLKKIRGPRRSAGDRSAR
jgi:hypothetical protein